MLRPIPKLGNKKLPVCEVCGHITFDDPVLRKSTALKAIAKVQLHFGMEHDPSDTHFHIDCLEWLIGRALRLRDLKPNSNDRFLHTDRSYDPGCRFLSDPNAVARIPYSWGDARQCLLDGVHCAGLCRYKTRGENHLEGCKTNKEE